ncbi:MAG: NAD(P)H-dependent glycerol-3-phosphate dehydrogenase [Clostridia bacterium]|nr:NAD(P)H-dependent glycerol-3-phosphate dehydrogenase [Clostridia bacterium]
MKKVAVIGSGSWGTAVSVVLATNGHSVYLWSYFKEESEQLSKDRENKAFLPGVILPENVTCTPSMEEAVSDADLVVLASPSHTVRNVAKNLAPYLKKEQPLLNIAKGLETETQLRLSKVIRQEIPENPIAVMSGPSHAEEVGRFLPTTNVVASEDETLLTFIQDIFMNKVFRVYTNPDLIGVEVGGALKIVIALCAGISDGCGFGDNTKAALMTRGITEIARLGVAMGASSTTFFGLTGIGDLIVTCTSMHSRNRRAGILIGQGKSLEETLAEVKMVVEGVKTTEAAYALAKKMGIEMPIVEQMYAVLFEGHDPKTAAQELMQREKKSEYETNLDFSS